MTDLIAEKLFATRRYCYFIPLDGFVEGHGWRPSVVFEGEPGHYPNGDWPYEGKPGQRNPWFWGPDYETAVRMADEMNDAWASASVSRSRSFRPRWQSTRNRVAEIPEEGASERRPVPKCVGGESAHRASATVARRT